MTPMADQRKILVGLFMTANTRVIRSATEVRAKTGLRRVRSCVARVLDGKVRRAA